jgi:putative solute:sodium symporter small subunit
MDRGQFASLSGVCQVQCFQRPFASQLQHSYIPRKYNKAGTVRSASVQRLHTGARPDGGRHGGRRAEGICIPLDQSIRRIATGVLKEELQPMPESTDLKQREEAHWAKTSRLMFMHLGVWFFFGYVIHMFVVPLNKITVPILNFPLGFYMAAQGSLIVFVVMLFMFAKQQDKIDREFGFAEED